MTKVISKVLRSANLAQKHTRTKTHLASSPLSARTKYTCVCLISEILGEAFIVLHEEIVAFTVLRAIDRSIEKTSSMTIKVLLTRGFAGIYECGKDTLSAHNNKNVPSTWSFRRDVKKERRDSGTPY